MTDQNSVAENYIALWNDADEASRRDRIAKEWSADARYADPVMQGDGHAGIAAMVTGARETFPGHAFTPVGTPDGHGPFVRFSWKLATSSGGSVAAGTDIVRLDGDGLITEVIGFLDGRAA